jgi:hypothetical protein
VPVSGIHDFRRLEAGFPIRIASGMTVSGTGGRLTLISFQIVIKDETSSTLLWLILRLAFGT